VLVLPGNGFAHGAYHEVIARLSAQIANDPARSDLLFHRAGVHLDHEDTAACLADLDHLDRTAPGRHPTDLLRGEALLKSGNPKVALPVLERFIATHPPQARSLTARARVLRALGQADASISDYRAALALGERPEPDAVQELAEALAATGLQREAADTLANAIATLGPVPSLVLKALDAELAAGDFDAALERIETMQKTAPRPEPWMARRARVLTQAGRGTAATQAWRELSTHLAALPNLERGSHAMSRLAAEAARALPSSPPPPTTPASPTPPRP